VVAIACPTGQLQGLAGFGEPLDDACTGVTAVVDDRLEAEPEVRGIGGSLVLLDSAVVVAVALGGAIGALTPNVTVLIQPGSVLRTGTGALVVGGLAALLPLRRVLRVDPATAFRRSS